VASHGGANGIDTYGQLLEAALLRRGHAARLVGRAPNELTRSRGRWALRRVAGPLESAFAWKGVTRLAADHQTDLVHFTYPEYVPVGGAVPSVASVWHSHPRVLERARSAKTRSEDIRSSVLFGISDRIAFVGADALAAVTKPAYQALRGLHANSHWIPLFMPESAVVESRRSSPPYAVVVATDLASARKNVQLAIRAVEGVRRSGIPLELVLVGGRSESLALPEFCRSAGPKRPEEVSAILREATCLILPSIYEEFGYVGLEALAAGCPLVVGPLDAYIGVSSPSVIVRSLETMSFADGILEACRLSDTPFPEDFREETAMDRLLKLYENVVS
jgi:glycosyltransferase involved in cell wall biosynthesis